jgi:hypothetical protein
MKPVAQTRPHPNGDCLRACLATLLELPITDVPDFTAMRDDPESELPVYYVELQHFCKRRGYAFFETQLQMKTLFPLPYETLAIFIGYHPSSTEQNPVRHAIVGQIAGQTLVPLFDPINPDGNPAEAFISAKVIGLCFLVPLDPARLAVKPPENILVIPQT